MAASKRKPEETSPLIEKFLNYKLVIQGRSPKTVDEYHLDLRLFFRYIISRQNGISTSSEEFEKINISIVDERFVRTIQTIDILEFMSYLASERKDAAAARSRKLSAIKAFFKYNTVVLRTIEVNPAADIESPKLKKALPKYMTLDESLNLLETINNDPESKTKERDYCIITLFLNCGMRLSELVGINTTDIDSQMRSLRVLGKGNKERIVYLNDACRDALKEYLAVRQKDIEQIRDQNALFLSRLHKRISPKTVQWLVYKYLGEAGLNYRHLSTHKLRHTAATLMYQQGGVDVLALQQILGHEQLSTTQIYTHVANEGLEKAVSQNPLAGVRRKDLPEKKEEQ